MSLNLDKLLEDGCNADAKHKLCRSRGGESCAFDGAAIVLMPIADAAHIVHGPISCAGNAWEGRGVHSTAGEMHRRGFTTDLTELDIVYGGEKRLEATVREVVAAEKPAAVFVYATCVTGLIGEDIDAVCKRLSSELWVPVIPVNAPGFVGPKNLGNRIAGEVLLDHVIGTAEPVCVTPTDLTLVGEYNVAGDLDLVEPLLRECGVRVLSRITGNARFEELRWAHRAKAAAVVCSRALINVASALTKRWDVPSIEVSFFGATEIARSLRSIAEVLEAVSPQAAGVGGRVERVIAQRERWLADALAPYAGRLRGKKAVLYSGGVKSWSMASALQDLGVEILAVGTKKSSHEDEEKVRRVLGDGVRLIEDISPAAIRKLFSEEGADLLVAGGRNRYLAAKEGWPFVDVNQEREHAYASYEGLLNLARDLVASLDFYDAQSVAEVACTAAGVRVSVRPDDRAGLADPLKNPPTTGAVMALQGIHGALPVLHSAQGCSFLGKVLLIRHFNEPISLATSKLFTEEVVLGSDAAADKVVRAFAEKPAFQRPELVALVTGALAEVKGEDVDAVARTLDADLVPGVVAVHAPDYEGGLEAGYAAAVAAVARLASDAVELAPQEGTRSHSRQGAGRPADVDRWRVTVLAGAHLTPGDVNWMRETCEAFGLEPVILPDLSALDGGRDGSSPLASGGTRIEDILALPNSVHTLVLGASLEPVACELHDRFGTPFTVLESVHGIAATDLLLATLSLLSGAPAPPRFDRQRRVLVDAMRDAHLEVSGARVTLALEPDHALSLAPLFAEMSAEVTAIVPTAPAHAARIRAAGVAFGDFASVPCATELLVSGSHGARTAGACGAAHIEAGFPVFASYGASRAVALGYAGATTLVDACANALAARERAAHPAAPAPQARRDRAPRPAPTEGDLT